MEIFAPIIFSSFLPPLSMGKFLTSWIPIFRLSLKVYEDLISKIDHFVKNIIFKAEMHFCIKLGAYLKFANYVLKEFCLQKSK